ncbi:McrC family protein [Psychrobacter sp. AOP22-C1-22]|uniref:McrC family protein n=1 Tax=unclassified Psychrobacter TaxID=196806 RepID=UPI0017884017|nr:MULTISPECIES: hypothetical protein [unclassified Psychrobacter]MBE0407668.1 hypothetical protein [Psychrobacter sp. FME6]MBE0446042.1 hypothetical protein [Psychrobacter sp. FME5]MDN5801128.1 McrC family protein [Psychrobacter sp.]
MNSGQNLQSNTTSNGMNNAYIEAADASVVTVFEHQRLTVHDFLQASDFHWLMAQEFSVFSIKRQQGQWQLKVGHYIGIILLPSGLSLEILPKLNKSVESNDIAQTRHWVQHMLSDLTGSSQRTHRKLPSSKNFGQFSNQVAALPLEVWPLSDWLIAQFLQRLTHYQPIKHYQSQVHNQASLQGRLLIKEQLRHNSMQPHKFVCESSILSQDMLGNRLIKSALVLLTPLFFQSTLSQSTSSKFWQLWQPVSTLTPYDMQRLESVYAQAKRELAMQPLRAQQLQAAQQLVDLAYWLLQQSATATGNGMDTQRSFNRQHTTRRLCLLIDMNQAFEQWASQRLASIFQQLDADYRPLYQTQHVWLSDAAGQACLSIRPDLLIYQAAATEDHSYQNQDNTVAENIRESGERELDSEKSGRYSHVIDIKWKHLSHASDVSASDAYQLISYAQAYQADQVWLVYPVRGDERQPVALKQQIYQDKNANSYANSYASSHDDKVASPAQLWLIPFDVLTGSINGGLLPEANVV